MNNEEASNWIEAPYSSVLTTGKKRSRAETDRCCVVESITKRYAVGEELSEVKVSKELFSGDCERSPAKLNNENTVNFSHGTRVETTRAHRSPTRHAGKPSSRKSPRMSPKATPKRGVAYIQHEMQEAVRKYRPPTCSSSSAHDATLECNFGGFKVNNRGSRGVLVPLTGKAFVEYILHFKVFSAPRALSPATITTRSVGAAQAALTAGGEGLGRPRGASVKVVLMRRYSAFYDLLLAVRSAARGGTSANDAFAPVPFFSSSGQSTDCSANNRFACLDQMFPEKNPFIELPVDVSVAAASQPLLKSIFTWGASEGEGGDQKLQENAAAAATEDFYNQRQIDLEAWFLALLETVGAEFSLHETAAQHPPHSNGQPSTSLEALNQILNHIVLFLTD